MAYPDEPEQELSGAVDVDVGDVSVASQHAVHRGRDVLPVLLGLGVEFPFILHHFAGHDDLLLGQSNPGSRQHLSLIGGVGRKQIYVAHS